MARRSNEPSDACLWVGWFRRRQERGGDHVSVAWQCMRANCPCRGRRLGICRDRQHPPLACFQSVRVGYAALDRRIRWGVETLAQPPQWVRTIASPFASCDRPREVFRDHV
jgi:hypothetical protein